MSGGSYGDELIRKADEYYTQYGRVPHHMDYPPEDFDTWRDRMMEESVRWKLHQHPDYEPDMPKEEEEKLLAQIRERLLEGP
jgi:hypothetical protein